MDKDVLKRAVCLNIHSRKYKHRKNILHEFILKLKQETLRIAELHPVGVVASQERKRRINEWRY